jgi:hypothetical protein
VAFGQDVGLIRVRPMFIPVIACAQLAQSQNTLAHVKHQCWE